MGADSELTVEGLAHDLNNVFETLAEAAELLAADSKWTKLASTIRRSVRRGERIVESLNQTFADTGDLCEILDNAVQHTDDVLHFTRGSAIQYQRQVEPSLALPGSPAAWERVFVNLFLNAAQANPQSVEVVIRASGTENGGVMLTVADNGPGIPASILPSIFEPDVTTKKSRGRRGLGLHIVQSIVAEQGGTVKAENQQPRGAIFTVTLPQARVS
ncbi:MAG TPA: HAMP domain-containing sensor histidine kinase [Bryobacteraceae bacterium]|nr:HAMP domain-containing sensor histidine kinase [Bryobacteraceae bacterium]